MARETEANKNLVLSEEEAMGLLDIVLVSPGELTPEQRSAVLKLTEFCREHLRTGGDGSSESRADCAGEPLRAR